MQYSLTLSDEEDIFYAYQWYEQQRNGLGDEFNAALKDSFYSIQSGPETYGFREKISGVV